jgi:transcription-repair coupling factor (superfamily II helicase)
VIYKRLTNCNTQQDLDDMPQELIDRVGLLPEPVQTLFDSHRLRIMAKPLGISKVDASSEAIVIHLWGFKAAGAGDCNFFKELI